MRFERAASKPGCVVGRSFRKACDKGGDAGTKKSESRQSKCPSQLLAPCCACIGSVQERPWTWVRGGSVDLRPTSGSGQGRLRDEDSELLSYAGSFGPLVHVRKLMLFFCTRPVYGIFLLFLHRETFPACAQRFDGLPVLLLSLPDLQDDRSSLYNAASAGQRRTGDPI